MIRHCPECGKDVGLTHGDQTWIDVVCEDCSEPEVAEGIDDEL